MKKFDPHIAAGTGTVGAYERRRRSVLVRTHLLVVVGEKKGGRRKIDYIFIPQN